MLSNGGRTTALVLNTQKPRRRARTQVLQTSTNTCPQMCQRRFWVARWTFLRVTPTPVPSSQNASSVGSTCVTTYSPHQSRTQKILQNALTLPPACRSLLRRHTWMTYVNQAHATNQSIATSTNSGIRVTVILTRALFTARIPVKAVQSMTGRIAGRRIPSCHM